MNKLIKIIVISAFFQGMTSFGIEPEPGKSILQNSFLQLEISNLEVFALSEQCFSVLKWDSTEQILTELDQLLLPASARSMKRGGDGFVVRHVNDDLSFIGIRDLANVELMGTITPSKDYFDFEVIGGYLYLSRWFDGIDQFKILNFTGSAFIKNDLSGVLSTQLQRGGSALYALDMYNGVNRYDLSTGFGSSINRLLVGERPFAMSVLGDLVLISGNSDVVTMGWLNRDSAEIIGTITGYPSPKRVLRQGSPLVFLSEREVHLREVFSFVSLGSFPIDSVNINGAIMDSGRQRHLFLPKHANGIMSFNLSELNSRHQILDRPGPITSALVHDFRLFTCGGGNPLEMYEIIGDSLLSSVLLRDNFTGVTDLEISDNFLYALYANEQKILVFDISSLSGVADAFDTLSVSISNASEIKVYNVPEMSTQLLTVENRDEIEVFANQFGSFEPVAYWMFDKPMADMTIFDRTLFVTDRFEKIVAYSIQNDFSLLQCGERNLTGTGWSMVSYHDNLFVFTGNTMTAFTDGLALDTIVRLSSYVLDAEVHKDTLYTVGPDGIVEYDLSTGLPVFIDSGGLKGSQISVDGGIIATTDGTSINLYFGNSGTATEGADEIPAKSITLYENFPEPFNASTTIQFELPSNSDIKLSVYNLLGQQVRLLADQIFAAGRHSIEWDAKDEFGNDVVSGVYFYRLESHGEVFSRKMMMVK